MKLVRLPPIRCCYLSLNLILFFLLSSSNTLSQFVQNTGVSGGKIRVLAYDGSRLYAGLGGGGIYASDDLGKNWARKNNGINNYYIRSFLVKDGYLFAGVEGIYRSSDKGESWSQVNGGLLNSSVTALASIDSVIFAAAGYDIYASTDYGNNWETRGYLPSTSIHSMISVDSLLFLGTWDGVFFSSDHGTSWISRNNGLPSGSINQLTVGNNRLFAALSSNFVYVSEDNGLNWSFAGDGLPVPNIFSIAYIDSALYGAPFGAGIYKSTDNGSYWTPLNNGYSPGTLTYAFTEAGGILFAGCESGVYEFVQAENQWYERNNNIFGIDILCMRKKDGSLYAGTSGGKIYRSSDSGISWERLTPVPETFAGIEDIAFKGDTLYAIINGYGYLSTDNGYIWETIFLPSYGLGSIAVKGENIFIGSGTGIWRSTDGGNNWEQKNNGLIDLYISDLAADEINVYAGTWEEGLFISSDEGENWTRAGGALPSTYISTVETGRQNVYAGTLGFYLSTNHGSSWSYKGFGNTVIDCIVEEDTIIYTGALGQGVFLSTNYGNQWQNINEGLPVKQVMSLGFSDSLLFAGTYDFGIWNRTINLSNTENPPDNVTEFLLEQNYPNPFNPTTSMKYSTPVFSHITISIFDILGNEIAVLVNEEKYPGNYKVEWNAGSLSAGIYFYRLTAGGYSVTRKMVLMK